MRANKCAWWPHSTVKMCEKDKEDKYMNENEGNFAAGFVIGFILGVIGLLIAVAVGKKQTTKGAAAGMLAVFVLVLLISLFSGIQ